MKEKSSYTSAQARKIGFNRKAYARAGDGFFIGTLVMKVYSTFWLRCYFETAEGEKLKLTVWESLKTRRFIPKGYNGDFKDVPLKTKWEIAVGKDRQGNQKWAVVREIKKPRRCYS